MYVDSKYTVQCTVYSTLLSNIITILLQVYLKTAQIHENNKKF